MTFLQFARKNLWRKPLRTLLLVVSVTVTFFIYGLTESFVHGSQGTTGSSEDILGVMNATGFGEPMPISYASRIKSDEDVAAVSFSSRLRGFVDNERKVITLSAVEPKAFSEANGIEFGLTPQLVRQLSQSRDNVLVGRALADSEDWRIGQSLGFTTLNPFRADGDRNIQLKIAGIFEGKNASTDTYFLLGRYDYINALRTRNNDTADVFIVRPRKGAEVSELAARIDAMFANSATPTRTQSEKQFLQAFMRQYADIGLIVDLIVGASFVTLLMIVVNTMVLAVRERYFEIGVLKTLGFSRGKIFRLILSETLFVFLAGGIIALILTRVATALGGAQFGFVLSFVVLVKCVVVVLALALVTGFLPAMNAMRISVIAALKTR